MADTRGDPPQLWLRVHLGAGSRFGPGKAALLRAIAECGSISAAGRRMGMSYKRAWTLVETMNRDFAEPLVAASRGGAARGGAELTANGAEVLRLYDRVVQQATRGASAELDALHALRRAAPCETSDT